jgi:hypothetical protein
VRDRVCRFRKFGDVGKTIAIEIGDPVLFNIGVIISRKSQWAGKRQILLIEVNSNDTWLWVYISIEVIKSIDIYVAKPFGSDI